MDPRLSAFFDILQHDLFFVDELMETYEEEILSIGELIQKHTSSFYIRNDEKCQELIDFLDGNGFKIGETIRAFSAQEYILVWPQYAAPAMNWFTTTATTTVGTYYHEELYQLVLPILIPPLAPKTIQRIVDAFTRIDLVARPPPKE